MTTVPFVLSFFVLVLATYVPVLAWSSYECKQTTIPINISTQLVELNLSEPQNQTVVTGLMTDLTSQSSNVSTEVLGSQVAISGTYDIWTMLCVPASFPANGTLEFTVHGVEYDHSYWVFGGEGSPYNYAEVALSSGHAVFLFDRLGQGASSKPNGLHVVQAMTGVEVVASLVQYLREGQSGYTFGRIVGVAHSLGSIITAGTVVKYGNVFDAIVLTGFSAYAGGLSTTFAGLGSTIAARQDPVRWGSLDNAYVTTGSIVNTQMLFYHWPGFDPQISEHDEATKGTLTLGEILTEGLPLTTPALNYTNPVFIIIGDKDYIFCGGDCYQSVNGSADVVGLSSVLFPSASEFLTHIVANTGHSLNMHYSVPETFEVIQRWIG